MCVRKSNDDGNNVVVPIKIGNREVRADYF